MPRNVRFRNILLLAVYLFLTYCVVKQMTKNEDISFTIEKRVRQIYSTISDGTTKNSADMATEYVHNTNTDIKGNCETKQNNIVFVKVHKAGSTTVMNVLIRYAMKRNLNVVLSSKLAVNLLSYPGHPLKSHDLIPPPMNESYNILCNHAVYEREVFKRIMPNDSMYIGIVREPVSRFISSALYFQFYSNLLEKLPHLKNNTEEVFRTYFKNPEKFNEGINHPFYVFNSMAHDFGVKPSLKNDTKFREEIVKLDKEFKLIMLMERLEESLVLMKRYLCWDLKDIVIIPANKRRRHADVKVKFSDQDIRIVKQWNDIDVLIYEHFKSVFNERVTAEGPLFQDEVQQYKFIVKGVQKFCSKRPKSGLYIVAGSAWNDEFVVSNTDCYIMKRPEIDTMNIVKEKALAKLQKG